MKQTFKHSFDCIYFYNRWMMKRWEKPSDWCIIGIYTRWASYEDYCYGINIFGLECRVWFKRTIKSDGGIHR